MEVFIAHRTAIMKEVPAIPADAAVSIVTAGAFTAVQPATSAIPEPCA